MRRGRREWTRRWRAEGGVLVRLERMRWRWKDCRSWATLRDW
jgi:hypothetical protein